MSTSARPLRSSKAEALAAKDAFSKQFAAGRTDRAIGVGLNSSRDDWAVKVYATTESATMGLPETFDGYEVEVRVTGAVSARA